MDSLSFPEEVEEHCITIEEKLDLSHVLYELDEKYKSVLILRFYHDQTVKQIAELLECPEGTVKTNIHRGLALLKQKMKGAYKDDRRDKSY